MTNVTPWPVIPRPVPVAPKPKLATDPDERASLYALANADEVMRMAMTTAYAEGPQASLDMMENAKFAVKKQFNLFGDPKAQARMDFYHAFRRYASVVGSTLEALELAGDIKVAMDKERAVK